MMRPLSRSDLPRRRDRHSRSRTMSVTHGTPHYPIAEEDLPTTWVVEFLGEVIRDFRNGVSKGDVSKVAGGIPQLRPMNIDREGRLVLTGMKYVPENLGPDVRGG